MTFSRLLSRASVCNRVGSRFLLTGSKPDTAKPNWFRVGLAFGSTAFIWGLLFTQHNKDIHEYRIRNGLE